jgi:hypothetical protein
MVRAEDRNIMALKKKFAESSFVRIAMVLLSEEIVVDYLNRPSNK